MKDEIANITYELDKVDHNYHKLFNKHDKAMLLIDPSTGKIIEANEAAVKYYGYSIDELLNKKIQDINILDEKQVKEKMKLAKMEKRNYFQFTHRLSNNQLRDVEVHSYPFKNGNKTLLFSLINDISDKRAYETELLLFKKALEVNSEGVVITDDYGNALWINNAFSEITGYYLEDVFGKNVSILKSGIQDQDFYEDMWQQLIHKGKWSGEIWNKNKKGDIYSEWLTINEIKLQGKTYYVGIFKDLSEKKKIDRRMNDLQQKDSLTGLYNRNYFIELVDTYIRRYNEKSNRLAIVFVDIEGFKEINSSLGHLIGDKLLIEVSKRLLLLMNGNYFLSRFIGDKFGIICRKFNDKNEITFFAKNILDAIKKPFKIENTILHVEANIGISLFPEDGKDIETLIRYGDIALNKAKELVEEKICFYSKEMSMEIEEKFLVANYLVEAIPNNELTIYYQPIFNIKQNNKIIGAEALLRWKSPILGEVSPDIFIPLAEKTGQIIEIGEWVLEKVCKEIYLWEEKGYNMIPIGINISVKQLEQVGFAEQVIKIMEIYNIEAHNLELEITESVSLGELVVITKNLQTLKKRGIKISMDDFGTGFSSLGQLDLFELDKLKIDKIFIDDIVSVPKRQDLVKSIVAMAKSLDLTTVAEGIETKEQLSCLKEIGCHLGQGYLFSEPLKKSEIELLLGDKD